LSSSGSVRCIEHNYSDRRDKSARAAGSGGRSRLTGAFFYSNSARFIESDDAASWP